MKRFLLSYLLVAVYMLATPRTMVADGYFAQPNWWMFALAAVVGTLIFALRPKGEEGASGSWKERVVQLGGLGLFAYLLPQPMKSLAIVSFGALALAALYPKKFAFERIGSTICLAGLISVMGLFYNKSALYLDTFISVAKPLSWFLSLTGLSADQTGGTSHLIVVEEVFPMNSGFSALFPLGVFLLFVSYVATRDWRNYRSALMGVGAFAGIAFLRVAILLVSVVHWQSHPIRTNETIELLTFLMFLPTMWIGAKTVRAEATLVPATLRTNLLAAGGLFLLVFGVSGHPQGERKAGRILVHEGNSTWEPIDSPVNEHLYGVRTMYNYTNLGQDLARNYQVTVNRGMLTEKILRDVDVLILKCPTAPYQSFEGTAIENFVRDGGGVWMISDHTDVFGMSVYLNELASLWGFRFGPEAVIDESGGRQLYGSSAYFEHPTTRRLAEPYMFYTGCSIYAAPWVGTSMIGNRMLMDKPDYSTNTFFGDFQPGLGEYFGPVPQTMSIEHGRGRIAAWADSTVFSGFSVFMPGQAELAHDTIDWLNHKSPALPWKKGAGAVGIVMLVLAAMAPGGRSVRLWTTAIAVGSLGLASAAVYNSNIAYSAPELKPTGHDLLYVAKKESSTLPLLEPNDEPTPIGYTNSFVSTQRVGFRPQVIPEFEAGRKAEVVVVNGRDAALMKESELHNLLDYARGGGNLVLIDFEHAKGTFVLGELGLRFEKPKLRVIHPASGKREILYQDACSEIKGDFEEVLLRSEGSPIFVKKPYGKGTVYVAGTTATFSDEAIGRSTDIPNQGMIALLRAYWHALRKEPAKQAVAMAH